MQLRRVGNQACTLLPGMWSGRKRLLTQVASQANVSPGFIVEVVVRRQRMEHLTSPVRYRGNRRCATFSFATV